ncbi:hypothetical protein ACVBEH_20495, partial [Roseateles sp. GG27B]
TSLLGLSSLMTGLGYVSTNPTATTSGVGAVAQCNRGYTPPASLTKTAPAALPTSGGVFYTPAELATWKQRVVTGPFVKANDYTTGSPGDWTRIVTNAKSLAANGEVALTASTPESNFGTHGTLARDAAFYQLVTADGTMLAPVRKFLLAQAANAATDFSSTLCITDKTGNTADSKYFQASWLLRYIVTYDYVRGSLSSADRLIIENFIRRNAHFMAGHIDWGLANIFPARQTGDYSKRSDSAVAKTDSSIWWTKNYDTNGDCKVDATDKGASLPVYTYVTASGAVGPRISILSQYYNNRKSIASTAFGAAGILLGDTELITSAKRYFMEWLAYGVWPDGSQGEYARNGDYCIAQQGPIYAASNTQGAIILARLLARQGDKSMVNFSTTDGLFGTQSAIISSPKSIELTAKTQLNLLTGQLKWFFYEPWRTSQNLTKTGSLGNTEVRYMNSTNAMDDYHELGLLPAAALLPNLPIASVVMRDKAVTTLRFPGSTGNSVPTGFGNWNDAFNAMPAVLLLRP